MEYYGPLLCRISDEAPTVRPFPLASSLPGVGVFDREAVLRELRGICRHQARKLLAGGVNHKQIAVWTVIPTKTDVGAGPLRIRRVHLENRRQCQKSRESVIGLKAAKYHRKIAPGNRQAETIPLLRKIERKPFAGSIRSPYPRLVQMAVIVAAEPLKQAKHPSPVLRCAISELMTCPTIKSGRNDHILVNVEWRDDSLSEYVDDVVVSVSATVKFGAKGSLPLLGLQDAVSVGSMKKKTFEAQVAYSANLRSRFEIDVGVVA